MENLNFLNLLQSFFQTLVQFSPRVLGAIAVLLIGWVFARFLRRILKKVLHKIGTNKLSDYINDMSLFGERSVKISLSNIVSTFVYYFLMLMVWVAATDVLGIPAITDLLQSIIDYLPNLIVAFIYLLIGIFLADMARKFVLTTLISLGIPSSRLIAGFIFYFLIINILLGALTQAKINTEFIAGNISIILGGIVLAFAIGYGLASKDVAGNLISSFYWKDKFNIGDTIIIEDVQGRIQKIEKSHLVLERNDHSTVIVPMSKISKNIVSVSRSGRE